MDRRAAVRAAERSRRQEPGDLDRRGRPGRRKAHQERPDGQGDGRRPGRLRSERRAGASRPWLPASTARARVRRHLQREVAQDHQGRGRPLRGIPGELEVRGPGPQGEGFHLRAGTEVGDYVPFGGRPAARTWSLRDFRSGLVGRRDGPPRGSVDRWRPYLEGRAAAGARVEESVHQVSPDVEVER